MLNKFEVGSIYVNFWTDGSIDVFKITDITGVIHYEMLYQSNKNDAYDYAESMTNWFTFTSPRAENARKITGAQLTSIRVLYGT